jgi:hypothetical protein
VRLGSWEVMEFGIGNAEGGRWVAMEVGKRDISVKLFLCWGSVKGTEKKTFIFQACQPQAIKVRA